jgi:hypothetical protein
MRDLTMKTIDYLKNYCEDLEYKIRGNDVDSINYGTSGTPYFETHAAAVEYVLELRDTIKKMEREDKLRVFDCLFETAWKSTGNENVYDDERGNSASWDEVRALREYIRRGCK